MTLRSCRFKSGLRHQNQDRFRLEPSAACNEARGFSAWSPGRGRAGSNRRKMSINPGKINVFFRIRFDKTSVNI